MLFPNCSEATFRLDVKGLTEKEIDVVKKHFLEAGKKWEDIEVVELNEETIFGKKIMSFRGDYPYNGSEEIEEAMEKARKEIKKKVNYEINGDE